MKKILQKIILILIVVLLSILFSTKIIVNSYQEQNKIKNLNVTNDKNRKIIQHIVDFNGFIIASVLDGKIYYHHKNHQGSTVLLTNENGEKIKNFEYDSYGKPINLKFGDIFELLRRFTVHAYDVISGLYYAKARYYNSKDHRFLTSDPKRQFDNTYNYVGNDPINYIDPNGKILLGEMFEILTIGEDAEISIGNLNALKRNIITDEDSSIFNGYIDDNLYTEFNNSTSLDNSSISINSDYINNLPMYADNNDLNISNNVGNNYDLNILNNIQNNYGYNLDYYDEINYYNNEININNSWIDFSKSQIDWYNEMYLEYGDMEFCNEGIENHNNIVNIYHEENNLLNDLISIKKSVYNDNLLNYQDIFPFNN